MSSPPQPDFSHHLAAKTRSRSPRHARPSDALRQIPDRARVVIPPLSGTPVALCGALAELRAGWSELELACGSLLQPIAPIAHAGEPFRFSTYQASAPLRDADAAGLVEHVPASYAQVPLLHAPDGPRPADAVLVQVAGPSPDGRYSLSTSVGGILDAMRAAPLVIAQVNPRAPYTFGASEIDPDEFDFLVQLESELPSLRRAEPGPAELAIARSVAALVPDAATLQFGLGSVPEALMGMLAERRHLAIHSGLISDGVMALARSGAVPAAGPEAASGRVIATEAAGGGAFYRWLHRNPLVRMAPAGCTHSLEILARLQNFVAVNSAVQVALDGAVNAESVAGRQISGPGGQPDFAAGASLNGGISVIAMPSTAARGKRSRIVPRLDPGAVVTTPRYHADRVVTEHGAAELRLRSLSERRRALAAIAHPDFRNELLRDESGRAESSA